MAEDWSTLELVKIPGVNYYTLNNRRLHCMKMAAKQAALYALYDLEADDATPGAPGASSSASSSLGKRLSSSHKEDGSTSGRYRIKKKRSVV